MAERYMRYIVQQGSETCGGAIFGGDAMTGLMQRRENPFHQPTGAEAVLKARVNGARKNQRRCTQLLYSPQPLNG
jgi:hypothetical protein